MSFSVLDYFPYSNNEIKKHILNTEITDEEVISCLKATHHCFTNDREKISKYVSLENWVSSYCLFYLPTDFPKLSFIFRNLEEGLVQFFRESNLDIFDIGCGPGTFSLAWYNFFKSNKHHFHLIDTSSLMLRQAEHLVENLFNVPSYSIYRGKGDVSSVERLHNQSIPERKRVALFGHSINEMGAAVFKSYLEKIDPDILVIIEPGTSKVFGQLSDFMPEMLTQGKYNIIYPCLASKPACPMLVGNVKNDWCHQIMRPKFSHELQRLAQILSIDRRTVSLVGQIYLKDVFKWEQPDRHKEHWNYTLVRFLGETKYSWRYLACPTGAKKLVEIELMKNKMTKAESKIISELCVGDRVNFESLRLVEGRGYRGKIKL